MYIVIIIRLGLLRVFLFYAQKHFTTFPEEGGGGKCPLLPMPVGAHGHK